jgi:cyanophycinase-like exopeptidase
MPKSAKEPALEVADFIIHTAGGQARQKIGDGKLRKDFQAIFRSMGPKLTSLIDIDDVHRNKGSPGAAVR